VYNAAQILLALLGFAGIAWFVLTGLFSSRSSMPYRSTSRPALFIGLSSWLGLVILRHDVVAATGLVVAMVLLWRFFWMKN